MAKQAVAVEAKPTIVQRATDFVTEVRQELDKVTWPTAEDVKVSTKVCLYMLLGMVTVIFAFDRVFNFIVMTLLKLAG